MNNLVFDSTGHREIAPLQIPTLSLGIYQDAFRWKLRQIVNVAVVLSLIQMFIFYRATFLAYTQGQ